MFFNYLITRPQSQLCSVVEATVSQLYNTAVVVNAVAGGAGNIADSHR